jgi:serine/threonine protein kinase
MLLSEVEIYLRVSHPNVVKLIEVFEEPGRINLIMEVCTGGELYERLASRERYSEQTAARVTKEMLSAVAYLHSLQICHRDLKLENWLYQDASDEACIKLCDFGFGSFVHRDTFLTATLGSVHYVAPEVLAGQYGLSCDVWSVGVIIYMLLSGAPPFDGHNDKAIMAQVRAGNFSFQGKLWEGISENAKSFINALLRVDPQERLTAAQALEHQWLQHPGTSAVIDRQVLDSLHAFASAAALQRAALGLLLAGSVGREELQRLAGELSLADSAKSGRITAERFSEIMEPCLKPETREIFRSLVAGAGADAPLPYREVLLAAAAEEKKPRRLTRVHSGPSEPTTIYQPPGFYKFKLRPFYASHPVSNLVLGLVTGTSSFARSAWRLGLTRIGRLGPGRGGFFLLPNPKFHAEPREVQRRPAEGAALRFVVWWVGCFVGLLCG